MTSCLNITTVRLTKKNHISQILKKRSRIEILTYHDDLKGIIEGKKLQSKIDINLGAILQDEDEEESIFF
jgi:hypothetical protein